MNSGYLELSEAQCNTTHNANRCPTLQCSAFQSQQAPLDPHTSLPEDGLPGTATMMGLDNFDPCSSLSTFPSQAEISLGLKEPSSSIPQIRTPSRLELQGSQRQLREHVPMSELQRAEYTGLCAHDILALQKSAVDPRHAAPLRPLSATPSLYSHHSSTMKSQDLDMLSPLSSRGTPALHVQSLSTGSPLFNSGASLSMANSTSQIEPSPACMIGPSRMDLAQLSHQLPGASRNRFSQIPSVGLPLQKSLDDSIQVSLQNRSTGVSHCARASSGNTPQMRGMGPLDGKLSLNSSDDFKPFSLGAVTGKVSSETVNVAMTDLEPSKQFNHPRGTLKLINSTGHSQDGVEPSSMKFSTDTDTLPMSAASKSVLANQCQSQVDVISPTSSHLLTAVNFNSQRQLQQHSTTTISDADCDSDGSGIAPGAANLTALWSPTKVSHNASKEHGLNVVDSINDSQEDGSERPARRRRATGLTQEERQERRRKSNRESARRSRIRRLEETQESENQITSLQHTVDNQRKMLRLANSDLESLKVRLGNEQIRNATLTSGVSRLLQIIQAAAVEGQVCSLVAKEAAVMHDKLVQCYPPS